MNLLMRNILALGLLAGLGCATPVVKPTDPAYASGAAQSTAGLAGDLEREAKVRKLLDLLEEKVAQLQQMAEKGGPYFTALGRAYGKILAKGLRTELQGAEGEGEDVQALLELVLPTLADHDEAMEALAEKPGLAPGVAPARQELALARADLRAMKRAEEERGRRALQGNGT
jgi:hypothetical protein